MLGRPKLNTNRVIGRPNKFRRRMQDGQQVTELGHVSRLVSLKVVRAGFILHSSDDFTDCFGEKNFLIFVEPYFCVVFNWACFATLT